MAVVEKDVGAKPLTEESLLDALNREVVPVLRTARGALNRFLMAHSETVGDGVATLFNVNHELGTTDVFVQLKDASSGVVIDPSTYTITVVDADNVTVLAPAPPAANDLRISVRV